MAAEPADLTAVIDARLAAFDKPGVLSVRPGFRVRNDWLTDQRCIVVTVRQKVAHPPAAELLPAEVAGLPVDVRQASPEKRRELEQSEAYAAELRLTPDTGSVPHFPDERTLTGARPAAAAPRMPGWPEFRSPSWTTAGRPG